MSGSGAPTEIAGADTGAASAMSPPPQPPPGRTQEGGCDKCGPEYLV